MAETAQELLNKMREARSTGTRSLQGPTIDPEDFHVKLVVNVNRRRQLVFYATCLFILLFLMLVKNARIGAPWPVLVLPIVALGGLTLLLPPAEDWLYRPWQTRARQYERHQVDR